MLHPLKNLLSRSLARSPLGRQVRIAMILEGFAKIVEELYGEAGKKRIKPLYLKDKTLTVATLSSVLAQELKLKESVILGKINAKFGQGVVENIRYIT